MNEDGKNPPEQHRLSRRQLLRAGGAAFVLAPIAAACGGSSSGGSSASSGTGGGAASPGSSAAAGGSSKPSGTLAYAPLSVTPNSPSPLTALAGDAPVLGLAYDPLFYLSGDGTVTGALASQWAFESGNTVLNVTLRPGVKFSDGTPVTAAAVKAHLDSFKATSVQKFKLKVMSSVTATGPMTLSIELAAPDPDFIRLMSDADVPGHIVSAAGLANPTKLHTSSAGTGPYTLDSTQSVPGDHYVYVPNPNYWDPTRRQFTKVTIRSIQNPESSLASLQTGQLDLAAGTLQTAAAAKSAGLTILTAVGEWIGIGLIDRDGVLTKALGDLRVRQALNYAVDRTAITKGIYGQYGTPTDGIYTPGENVANYPYDPNKAKQLLAAAGYANGFTMPLLASTQLDPNNNIVTAVADAWSKIGVKCKITSDPINWASRFSSKQFPAAIDVNTAGDLFAQAQSQLLPSGVQFNPFGSSDAQITSLYNQAVRAPAAQSHALLKQMADRVRDLAWYVPICTVAGITLERKGGPTFTPGPQNGYINIAELKR